MEFKEHHIKAEGRRVEVFKEGEVAGRAYVYFLTNDLHEEPFAFLEDVFVEEKFRGQGVGKELVAKAIEVAQKAGCYKILGTSRYSRENVHQFYQKLGFEDYGKEFRMNL